MEFDTLALHVSAVILGLQQNRLLTALLGNGSQKSLPSNPLLGFQESHVRPDVRPGVRPADGRRRRSSAAPLSSAAPKKNPLIEAAPFGCLDQMLIMIVLGGGV